MPLSRCSDAWINPQHQHQRLQPLPDELQVPAELHNDDTHTDAGWWSLFLLRSGMADGDSAIARIVTDESTAAGDQAKYFLEDVHATTFPRVVSLHGWGCESIQDR